MLLQDKQTGELIEILDVQALSDPTQSAVPSQSQDGQEEQDPVKLEKANLAFPSGESLPRCWVDANYREQN